MDVLDDDVLKLILQPFDGNPEAFFLRTVCRRWATLLKPNKCSYNQIAKSYAASGSRAVLEYLNQNISRYYCRKKN